MPLGLERHRVPEPVSGAAIEASSAPLVDLDGGIAFGLFTDQLKPQGVFVGLIMPEPMTGVPVGLEHVWWCAAGVNGLPLLREFEKVCKACGCARVICGYSMHAGTERLQKVYRGLGYEPYLMSVSKKL